MDVHGACLGSIARTRTSTTFMLNLRSKGGSCIGHEASGSRFVPSHCDFSDSHPTATTT